jgi:hypothetical protein
MNTTTFDPADIERRRAAAYRQIPALRQQALDEAAQALRQAGRALWRGAAHGLRTLQATRGRPSASILQGS